MRIVNKQEFYSLPSGTVFSEFDGFNFTDILVKADTINMGNGTPCDYVEMSLIAPIDCTGSDDLLDILANVQVGDNIAIDFDNFGRNGLYEDDQLYAIYEKEDLIGMLEIIQKAIDLYD